MTEYEVTIEVTSGLTKVAVESMVRDYFRGPGANVVSVEKVEDE